MNKKLKYGLYAIGGYLLAKLLFDKAMDYISKGRIEKLHPAIRAQATQLLQLASAQGIHLRITQGMRTIEEQNALYAQGRTLPGKVVTNAKGGDSYHNYGLAFDVVPIVNGVAQWGSKDWDKIGKLGESIGLRWGGRFKSIVDKPHFEIGPSISQLKNLLASGKVKNGFVDIG